MSKRFIGLLPLLAAGSLLPVGQLSADQHDQRVDRTAVESRELQQLDTAARTAVIAQPGLIEAARPQLESVREVMRDMARRTNDREALTLDGPVFAISPDRTQVSEVLDLDQGLAPGSLILNTVREDAEVSTLPAPLMAPAETETGQTYALSWELITPGGTFKAWGRDSTGLSFDGASGGYVGSFDVALTYVPELANPPQLNPPISVSIAAPNAELISPAPLRIGSVNQWHSVDIAVRALPEDRYSVSISANPADDGDRIEMPVSRPRVELSANPAGPIDGWGIGRTSIVVQAQGIRNPAGYEVALTSTAGILNPARVVLDAQGRGETFLRSSRQNLANVSVRDAGNFTATELRVQFAHPWLFLALAIVGGLLGSILTQKGRQHWLKGLTIGAVTGVVMALLYAVGVNWMGQVFPSADLALGGEALVVVLGAVGAIVGIRFAVPDTAGDSG